MLHRHRRPKVVNSMILYMFGLWFFGHFILGIHFLAFQVLAVWFSGLLISWAFDFAGFRFSDFQFLAFWFLRLLFFRAFDFRPFEVLLLEHSPVLTCMVHKFCWSHKTQPFHSCLHIACVWHLLEYRSPVWRTRIKSTTKCSPYITYRALYDTG